MTPVSAFLRLGLLLVVAMALLSETADSAAIKDAKVKDVKVKRTISVEAKENKLRLQARNSAKMEEKVAKKASLEKLQKKSAAKVAPGKARLHRAARDYTYEEEYYP